MSATVQIVLPGLFDLPLHELEPELLQHRLPHLNRLLRLATAKPNQAYTIDAILNTALLGQDSVQVPHSGLPMAQAFAMAGIAKAEHLLLCQAIHLQADMHSAVIVPIDSNQDNTKDIKILINDLKELFKVDCDISTIAEGVFLLHLKQFEAPVHYPHILSVLGKTVNPYIQQTRQILPWYKLLNEFQMFLHQHEVNQQRVQRGLLAINSLWFWGAGSRPPTHDSNLAWYCDDPLLNRFAESLGLAPQSCAGIDISSGSTDALVVDLRLLEFLKTGLVIPLDQLLLDIDRELLKPLLARTDKGRMQVLLRAGYEFDFEMKPSARMKFWRRHRNLSSWHSTLGDGYSLG
jgi:hypothetical protein